MRWRALIFCRYDMAVRTRRQKWLILSNVMPITRWPRRLPARPSGGGAKWRPSSMAFYLKARRKESAHLHAPSFLWARHFTQAEILIIAIVWRHHRNRPRRRPMYLPLLAAHADNCCLKVVIMKLHEAPTDGIVAVSLAPRLLAWRLNLALSWRGVSKTVLVRPPIFARNGVSSLPASGAISAINEVGTANQRLCSR